MHTLDAPDLYSSGKLNPVGIWDLMSDNQTVPQGFLAYIRQSYGRGYGNWIPSIAQLSEPGEYVLNELSSATPDNVAYMIKPDRFSTISCWSIVLNHVVGMRRYPVPEYWLQG